MSMTDSFVLMRFVEDIFNLEFNHIFTRKMSLTSEKHKSFWKQAAIQCPNKDFPIKDIVYLD
jgi:hypothetical protein